MIFGNNGMILSINKHAEEMLCYRKARDSYSRTHLLKPIVDALLIYFWAALRNVQKNNQPLSVALLDIDHFKKYNDNNGRIAGDSGLTAVAMILSKSLTNPSTAVCLLRR